MYDPIKEALEAGYWTIQALGQEIQIKIAPTQPQTPSLSLNLTKSKDVTNLPHPPTDKW